MLDYIKVVQNLLNKTFERNSSEIFSEVRLPQKITTDIITVSLLVVLVYDLFLPTFMFHYFRSYVKSNFKANVISLVIVLCKKADCETLLPIYSFIAFICR